MNIKKILIASSVSGILLASASALAGGPDLAAAPACPVCVPAFTPFLYLGGSAGWAYSDWNSFIASGATSNADTNGFAWGGKVGFQALDLFGLEAGIYDLPNSDQTLTANVGPQQQPVSVSGTVKSWFAYGAATMRAQIPTIPFLYVMGKVGGAYREVDHSGSLYDNVGDGSYSTVMFGASLEYDLGGYNLPLAVGVDYLYVPSSADSFFTSTGLNADSAPAAQVVVASLSARLAV